MVGNGTPLTNAKALVKAAQTFAVTSVPDFVPFVKTTAGGITDPDYARAAPTTNSTDGAGLRLGAAPVNSDHRSGGEFGYFGGQILPAATATTKQQVQGNQGLQVRRNSTTWAIHKEGGHLPARPLILLWHGWI